MVLLDKKVILPAVLIGVFSLALAGCGGGKPGGTSGGGSAATYGGAMPIGDYVAVTVDSTNRTVTYHNYTTSEHRGPYSYARVADPARNHGFQNLYQTEALRDYPNHYALFTLMDGVAVVYQMFDNNGTPSDYSDDLSDGWPVYALCRRAVNMDEYKGRAYNWNFKINSATGNFEAGFTAVDTDATGHIYGVTYNNRAEIERWSGADKGIMNLNISGTLGAGSFTYDPDQVANRSGNLTLIGTQSGDFALDFGPSEGAGKSWSSNYNGTYFTMVYENRPGGAQTMKPMQLTTSGSGGYEAAELGQAAFTSGTFQNLEDFPGGSHYGAPTSYTVVRDFQRFSGCAAAQSDTVKNAYQYHGCFIEGGPGHALTCFFDPDGRFLFFCMFEETGGQNIYRFGFGIKDPDYQP